MAKAAETTRVARILDIIWRIDNAPRRWTRKRLAEVFEVSQRSITSDLEIIRHGLRFDLRSDRGSGYYFASVPRLPAVTYSVQEALALILAAQAGRQFGGVPQEELSAAIARLTSVVPPELRSIVERFVSETTGRDDPHRERVLTICGEAISSMRSIDMDYAAASRDGEVLTRMVDPYAIFPYDRSWHVIGYCHLREDIRIFKVDRIREARVADQTFTVARGFDLAAYLSSGWGIMRGVDSPVEEVVLRFRAPSARWVSEETWHPTQILEWESGGSLRFTVTVRVSPELQRWVFGHGSNVDVLQPDHLRDWIRAEALAVVERAARDRS